MFSLYGVRFLNIENPFRAPLNFSFPYKIDIYGCFRNIVILAPWHHFLLFINLYIHSIYHRNVNANLALLPGSIPNLRSHSGPGCPLSTTKRALISIARKTRHFLPSSTRVEFYLPTTLIGALSRRSSYCFPGRRVEG